MLAVNNLTSAPEHTRWMAALPLGESPLLKVLWTHIKGRCFQSWLTVPPVEMPVPTHVPHSLPFRTPRSKGASGGSLSLSLGLSLPMWREGTPGENAPQCLRRLMERIQVYFPPRQDNSEIQTTPHPWGPSRTEAQWPGVELAHQGLACWLPSSPCHSSLPYRRCLRSLPNKLLELKIFFSVWSSWGDCIYRLSTWGLSKRHSSQFNRE